MNTEDRFWGKVDRSGDCWEWRAAVGTHGYGVMHMKRDGRDVAEVAHRLSLELSGREIPAGMHVDHACHNPLCVKPAHLRIVTNKQNHEHLLGAHADSRSGVRGVCWDKSKRKWLARVCHNGKNIQVGRFDSIEEAAAAVVAKRLELFTHNDMDRIPA